MRRGKVLVNLAKGLGPNDEYHVASSNSANESLNHFEDSEFEYVPSSVSSDSATSNLKNCIFSLDKMPKESAKHKCMKYVVNVQKNSKKSQKPQPIKNFPEQLKEKSHKLNKPEDLTSPKKSEEHLPKKNRTEEKQRIANEPPSFEGYQSKENHNSDKSSKQEALQRNKNLRNFEKSNDRLLRNTDKTETAREHCSTVTEPDESSSAASDVISYTASDVEEWDDTFNESISKPDEPDIGDPQEYVFQQISEEDSVNDANQILDANLQYSNTEDKKRKWDRRDLCPFCYESFTHFSRHLYRKHSDENEVQLIVNHPKKGPERKQLLDALRKKGNFQRMLKAKYVCPVKRPSAKSKLPSRADEYTVCNHCFGQYKKAYLYRHTRKCARNPDRNSRDILRRNPQGYAQTYLASFTAHYASYLSNSGLKREVFPITIAGDFSRAVKNYPLICVYGEGYIARHKKKLIVNEDIEISDDLLEEQESNDEDLDEPSSYDSAAPRNENENTEKTQPMEI